MVVRQRPDPASADRILIDARDLAADTLECIGDGIVCTDIAGCVTYLNKAAESMTGWLRSQATGRPLAEVMQSILPERDHSVATIRDRHGHATGAVMVLRHAQHDSLTGLPLRGVLRDRLGSAITFADRHSKCLAVAFLDLDDFKSVNDRHGHATGDQVLRSIAGRLLRALRQSDTVGRYGGDEFVIVLPAIAHARDATAIATKLVDVVAWPLLLEAGPITVAASLGIAIYPEHGETADTLIAHADAAMYDAKRTGPGRWRIFDGGLGVAASARRDR